MLKAVARRSEDFVAKFQASQAPMQTDRLVDVLAK
jgi:hypothetical protein